MVEIKDMKFDTSIAVLYKIRAAKGHTTVQETYSFLSKADIDTMLEVLRIAYNTAENKNVTFDEFLTIIAVNGFGFIFVTQLFSDWLEKLMFSGLSAEDIAAKKEQIMKSKPN